jgi:nucleotide-binding universal stress UspA family protein
MNHFGVVAVGVDGSAVSEAALAFAADEAEVRGAKLLVAHASDVPDPIGSHLHALRMASAEVATHRNLKHEVVLHDADAAELLVELSKETDLVVVGTHRMRRLRGWVIGSVSQRVAADADCPVITLSGPSIHEDGPIVLAASASEGGMAAMHFACAEARLRNVPVRMVRSLSTEDLMYSGVSESRVIGYEMLRNAAEAEVDKLLAVAQESYADVSITDDIADAEPYTAVLEAAASASLVVIGARRHRDAAVPGLGPVAAWLLHHTPCPLAIVNQSRQT